MFNSSCIDFDNLIHSMDDIQPMPSPPAQSFTHVLCELLQNSLASVGLLPMSCHFRSTCRRRPGPGYCHEVSGTETWIAGTWRDGTSYFYETKSPGFNHVDFGAGTGTEWRRWKCRVESRSCFEDGHELLRGGHVLVQ